MGKIDELYRIPFMRMTASIARKLKVVTWHTFDQSLAFNYKACPMMLSISNDANESTSQLCIVTYDIQLILKDL